MRISLRHRIYSSGKELVGVDESISLYWDCVLVWFCDTEVCAEYFHFPNPIYDAVDCFLGDKYCCDVCLSFLDQCLFDGDSDAYYFYCKYVDYFCYPFICSLNCLSSTKKNTVTLT